MSAAMPHAPTRAFNSLVTHGWNRLARVYNIPLVQRVAYRPPQDEIIAQLRQDDVRRVADVGCGTGILASRIHQDLKPDVVFGCDASVGMLRQAKARSGEVNWAYFPPTDEMRLLVEAAGFRVTEQRAVRRPVPNPLVPDVLTVARRA
ncbi:methyltransferase domain-containing protein [Nocardia sp. CA-128927]|uniref:methyltransferase domain-containing protein n=1 Tax=Nocardia sp. CA-128927 TaxID=3239975 RepID=UPI003D97F82B